MPEEIIEDIAAEKPIEKKPVSVLLSAIVAIAIGSGGGFYASQEMADTEMQTKIAGAKCEIIETVIIPEHVNVVDTMGTLDTVPAKAQNMVKSYNSGAVTVAADTFITQLTRKRGDSILYYGVFIPPVGTTPIIKTSFPDIK